MDGAIISISPSRTAEVIKEAHSLGIKHIWIQQGGESEEAVAYCKENGINCIHGECILMYSEHVGFPHNIHRFIWKVLGKSPR